MEDGAKVTEAILQSREHDADSNLLLPMLSFLDKHLNIATEGLEA